MKAAIYARYSTEMQSEASIEDQVRICNKLIEGRGWEVGPIYSDYGQSGATHLRAGYQKLLEEARYRKFDVVVAEGLDRLSRDQEHIAHFHKQMTFSGIPIFTVAEGEITELHIGLKGTMSALFLKDLALKTHRGLEGRVKQGKAAGGLSFGYKIERQLLPDGTFTKGDRAILEEEAEIVRRIFAEYANGKSPRKIAGELNSEGVGGPRGATWGPSTIYRNWKRGTGILNNELYVGRMVWNRQSFVKDPLTGKRQARLNPKEEWVIEEIPQLRIVEQNLWDRVKKRQSSTRDAMNTGGGRRLDHARRAKYLFSGLLKCACCGGGYVLIGKTRYGCANARNKGICDNRQTIEREDLEQRVLEGLKDRLLSPELIAEFVAEYQRAYNEIRAAEVKAQATKKRELAKVQKQLDDMVEAVCNGMYHPSMNDKMGALESRKAEPKTELEKQQEEPIRLHPSLSGIYREKVAELSEALNTEGTRTQAAELIRGLLTEVRLIPGEGALSIELVGELAAIMALENKSPRDTKSGGQLMMVAGGRIDLDRTTEEFLRCMRGSKLNL
ncbi:Recombinase [Roseovarius litorisediminis]|uniref:Recombinase n=1 Tax=Roseovarius litorisediminis TaxID=1312363 RepID=A0A1Y5TSV2_9RHOB|nr:recombinase family protein [Roseovarius litorisediminis]SLN67224.1 Recombinase [Roseovarius litorisediminis]